MSIKEPIFQVFVFIQEILVSNFDLHDYIQRIVREIVNVGLIMYETE